MPSDKPPLVYLPARWLYELAFCPRRGLDTGVQESLEKNGWLEAYPAEIRLRRGSYPRIEGNHRLAWLAKTGRLDSLVPCVIKYEGAWS